MKGEVDLQQKGWKMTAKLEGVKLATAGAEDDCWAERGKFDR